MKNTLLKLQEWFKNTNFKELAKKEIKNPIFWVRFTAYAIPLAFLFYVLYINFLPFGYNKTFIIDVGSATDTTAKEFYLEPSATLSEKKIDDATGETYRELNGLAYAVFKPKAFLKDAEISVSIDGDDVYLIPPEIDFSSEEIIWDYAWDFSQGLPKDWRGNAFMFEDEFTFNGEDSRITLPYSKDKFEDGPFSVYVKWSPTDEENNAQQVVGHFNWEIWQNKDNVEFRVGRMNDATGPAYSIKYPFDPDLFFGEIHRALAIYNPGENGYIELYIDDEFRGRTYFGKDKIYKNYGSENLSIGWSSHNNSKNPYFSGSIYDLGIISKNIVEPIKELFLEDIKKDKSVKIGIISRTAQSKIRQLKLDAVQK